MKRKSIFPVAVLTVPAFISVANVSSAGDFAKDNFAGRVFQRVRPRFLIFRHSLLLIAGVYR